MTSFSLGKEIITLCIQFQMENSNFLLLNNSGDQSAYIEQSISVTQPINLCKTPHHSPEGKKIVSLLVGENEMN